MNFRNYLTGPWAFWSAGFVLLLNACVPSDRQPPILEVTVNGIQGEEHTLAAGTSWNLVVDATDDNGLSQVRIDIHSAEGHDHGDGTGVPTGWVAYSGSWEVLEIVDLAGTEGQASRTFAIPFDVRGHWDLVVTVVDEAGNEAPPVVIALDVENDIIPEVHFSSVAGVDPATWTGEPVWPVCSWVDLEGQITDPSGLASVALTLHDAAGNLLWDWNVAVQGATVHVLQDVSIPLPFGYQGEVMLHVTAADVFGYVCETGFHAEVE